MEEWKGTKADLDKNKKDVEAKAAEISLIKAKLEAALIVSYVIINSLHS